MAIVMGDSRSNIIASAPRSGGGFLGKPSSAVLPQQQQQQMQLQYQQQYHLQRQVNIYGQQVPSRFSVPQSGYYASRRKQHQGMQHSRKAQVGHAANYGGAVHSAHRVERPLQACHGRRTSRATLVIDLDETLVHSSFDPMRADICIPVHIDGEDHIAYVKKRPHVDQFLARCVQLFDVVIWTASLSVYAEPLIQQLCGSAKCGNIRQMYREACTSLPEGGYVKDLAVLGRSMDDVCILDNSPAVAQLQPDNLIPIVSWYDDPRDTCLRDLIPHLEKLAVSPRVANEIRNMPHVRGGMTFKELTAMLWPR